MDKRNGYVYLLGTGCGDMGCITLEGLEVLRQCEVVIYDDLIDTALLNEVPYNAEKIYVGKRKNKASSKQSEIEDIIVEKAREGKMVVRAKGGDAFVFGRGGEEAIRLNKESIKWSVIPGISSSIAIPEMYGIPVTHRGLSRSFHVISAFTKDDKLRDDIESLSKVEGTLVFLMGFYQLEEIVKSLIAGGKDASTPVAVLSGGNSINHYRITGTLADISDKVENAKVSTPAVIVVGDVAGLGLYSSEDRTDICVGLTGTDEFQAKVKKNLYRYGIRSVSLMAGDYTDLECEMSWDSLLDSVSKWFVFTSARGVRGFFDRIRADRIDLRRLSDVKFAVIGSESQKALSQFGYYADFCPAEYNSIALAEGMSKLVKENEKIVLFCSKQGTGLFESELEKSGIACERYDIYDTCLEAREIEADVLEKVTHIVFGSAAGVRELHKKNFRVMDKTLLSIGPICEKAIKEHFGATPVVAEQASVEALIELLI